MVKARDGRVRGWPGAGKNRDKRRLRGWVRARRLGLDRGSPALRAPALRDIIDRCLDRGVAVEGWARVAMLDIDLVTVEARAVITSCESYLRQAAATEGADPRPFARGLLPLD